MCIQQHERCLLVALLAMGSCMASGNNAEHGANPMALAMAPAGAQQEDLAPVSKLQRTWKVGPYDLDMRLRIPPYAEDIAEKELGFRSSIESLTSRSEGGGIATALLLLLSKALVCYCSHDSEVCTAGIDLGCVLTMGSFALASRRKKELRSMHQLLIEAAVSHLSFEMMYNGVILRTIDPTTGYKMGWDMWVHHISSVVAGVWCLLSSPDFHKHGVDLLVTECTTGLPMAFRQALKSKKIKSRQGILLAASMPIAFTWRCYWNFAILKRFLSEIKEKGGFGEVQTAWIPATGLSAITTCNAWWLSRIIKGVITQIRRRTRKKPERAKKGVEGVSSQVQDSLSKRLSFINQRIKILHSQQPCIGRKTDGASFDSAQQLSSRHHKKWWAEGWLCT